MVQLCPWSAWSYDLALIEPETLHRDLSHWMILDARPKAQWQAGHVTGSLSFSWEDYTRTDANGVPYRIWLPEEMAAALGRMGVSEKSPVVVYGDADSSWGGEGWACWALTWLGHHGPVRLLTGGIQSWRRQGFAVSKGAESGQRPSARYTIDVRPEVSIATSALGKERSGLALVDTRSTREWLKGRIDGAIHLDWTRFYSGKDRAPISPEATRKLLAGHEIKEDTAVVYYCTGGIRSGYAWLVHQLSGMGSARNYEGGIEAWQRLRGERAEP